ncbi:MAG: calcium-binding protein, partial [Rhodocyclales bacterium]|nr:calcium-binding protein [Rhodocyclales bacterium]
MIYAGEGNDHAWGGIGNDVIFGERGNDTLSGEEGNDIILGGAGNDFIEGDGGSSPANTVGNDWIDGGTGDDRIYGMAGDDVIIGGTGNDTIYGGAGRDTYLFNKGDGIDRIVDASTGAEASILIFGAGFDKDSITLEEGSLLLDLGTGDAIHIENWDQAHPLDTQSFASFQFADGSSLSWSELLARGFDLDGTEGNDTIFGTGVDDRINGKGGNDVIHGLDGNDTLTGGAGTDAINGGLGDDTYLVRAGDAPVIAGATPIVETLADDGGTDTLELQGIALTNVSLATDQTGSYLMLAAGADKLLIQGGGDGTIDRFEFGSGEILTLDQLLEQKAVQGVGVRNTVANANITGTWADDQIVATGNGAVVDGGRGKDTIKTLAFGAAITGGKGADTIQAYGINNTIRYAVGDGTDSVETTGGNAQGNVLQLSGVTANDLTLGLGSQGELELRVGSEAKDLIRFKGFDATNVTANKAFDRIEFDDGSMLSYEALMSKGFDIAGSDAAETITGTGVADRVAAGAGDDVLDGGAGNDSLNGGAGRDSYRLGLGTGQDKVTESADEISDIR